MAADNCGTPTEEQACPRKQVEDVDSSFGALKTLFIA